MKKDASSDDSKTQGAINGFMDFMESIPGWVSAGLTLIILFFMIKSQL